MASQFDVVIERDEEGLYGRPPGYTQAQRGRRRIEKIFAWLKQVAGQRRTRFRGRERVEWAFTFAAATYNLMRMAKLSLATSV